MDNLEKAIKMAEINLIRKKLAERKNQSASLEPVKTSQENSSSENETIKEEIKFHSEAHRKNYEGIMKLREENKKKPPLDSKTMIEQIRKNSRD